MIDGSYDAVLIDINADGLPDRVKRTSNGSFQVHVNTGRGFSSTTLTWSGVSNDGHGGGGWYSPRAWDISGVRVEMLDVNGDGLVDRAIRDSASNLKVQLSEGPMPDLMTQVNNGVGGSATASYASTLNYGTAHKLPSHVQVVSQIVESPGGTTTYRYTNSYYDVVEREFRGFGSVGVTDPLNLVTTTYFHQGDGADQTYEYQDSKYKAGIPFRVTVGAYTDSRSTVDSTSWAATGGSVCFPFTKKVFTVNQEPSSNPRYTMTEYLYHVTGSVSTSTGNLLRQTDWGEVNSSGVDLPDGSGPLHTTNTYATIASNPDIRDHVETVRITSDLPGANTLRETKFEYYATTGNLYKKRDRICPGSYADTVMQYDQYGNVTVVTDPGGIVSTTEYDAATATYPWRKYTGILANNLIETMRYDPRSGLVTDSTNVQGLVSHFVFDGVYRPTETWISTIPNGVATLWITKYAYSFPNRYVKVTKRDPMDLANGLETYTYFDPWWRTIQTRSEAETNGTYRVNDFVYDNRGALILTTFPRFGTGFAYVAPSGMLKCQYTEYDLKGRPFRVSPVVNKVFPSGSVTVLTGDTDSLVGQTTTAFRDGTNPWATVVTDARGKLRKSLRDGFNNVLSIVEVTGAGNYTASFGYDLIGNLTNITDHALNRTALFYDELGRKVAMADPNTGYWQYGLDAAGRLKEQTDAVGQKTKLYYNDPAGRISVKEGLNSAGQVVSTISYTYDSNGGDSTYTVYPGQLFKVTDDEGWTKNSYDVRGRMLKTARYLTKNGQTYTTTSTYDDADRVETTAYPGAAAPTIRYSYDVGGNLTQVRRDDAGGPQIIYYTPKSFDEFGRLRGINFGNGITTDFSYYPVSQRLKDTITKLANQTQIQNLLYSYDQAGNFTRLIDGIAAHTGSASATISSASYDDLNRLTSATWSGYGTKAYSYDPIGNTVVNGEAGTGTYSYGTARPQAVKNANGKSYTYDLNGNMRMRGTQLLDYDVYNRLIKVRSDAGSTTEFGYGAGGERLWKTAGSQLTQVWIGSHYEEKDGKVLFHVMAEGRRVCTFEAAAAGSTGYDPALREFYYYHSDHLGSSSIMTERNGNEVQHYEYSAYGRDRHTSSSTAFPVSRRFTGQILDTDTGLYYYNARYYDPELGRFIQPDLVMQDLSDPQTFNPYTYCPNNPLRYTDPTGHTWGEYWSGVGQVFLGYYDAGAGLVKGTIHMVAHPIDTGKGIVMAVSHPIATATAIKDATVESWNSGLRGQGEVVGNILIAVGTAVAPGAQASNLSKAGEVANVGAKLERAGSVAEGAANAGVKMESVAAVAERAATVGESPAGIFNRGGRFADLDAAKLEGEVGHHMAQNAFNKTIGVSRVDGPAIGMTTEDHALTRTFAGRGKATMKQDKDLSARKRLAACRT